MPADDFCDALLTSGPALPAEAQIFAPFIGSWDLVVEWLDEANSVTRSERGEWHFAEVLEGRGIQDVWIVPPRDERAAGAPYEYGTSIRFYDPAIDAWQSTWIGPMHGVVRTFVARGVGDRGVLETTPDIRPAMRWSFHDVTPTTFAWSNEVATADRWRVQQRFRATRRATD